MFRCDIIVACAGTLLQKHLCWTRLELEDCFHLSQLWAPRQELDGSSCCLWHQVHSPPAQERFPGRCFAWPDQCTEGKVYQGPKIKHVILSLDIVILFTQVMFNVPSPFHLSIHVAVFWCFWKFCVQSGLLHSDFVTTVSPTYAREVLSPEVRTVPLYLIWHSHFLTW